jgi:hypothetical protein
MFIRLLFVLCFACLAASSAYRASALLFSYNAGIPVIPTIQSVAFYPTGGCTGTPYGTGNPVSLADASIAPQPLGTATASGTSIAQACVTMSDASTFTGTVWVASQSNVSPSALAQVCNNAAACTASTTVISGAAAPLTIQTARALAGTAGADDFNQTVNITAAPGAGETGGNVTTTLNINVTCPNCLFADNFQGTSLNVSNWLVMNGRHGEYAQNQVDCNESSAIAVNNGLIASESYTPSVTCGDLNIDGTVRHAVGAASYTTGDMQWPYQNFTYGTIRFVMQLQAIDPAYSSKSTWPSLWMLDQKCQVTNYFSGDTPDMTCPAYESSSPPYQEIDLIECDNSNWCQFVLNIPTGTQICAFNANDTSFHTYVMTWVPTSISLSRDGTQVCNFTSNVPNLPEFMIDIQQATSGGAGDPTNTSLPVSSTVRSIQVAPWSGQTGQRPLAVTFNPNGTSFPNSPISLPNTTASGVQISQVQVTTSDGLAFAGTLSFAAGAQSDSSLAALSGSNLVTGKQLSSSDDGYQIINVTATENNATVAGALIVNVH